MLANGSMQAFHEVQSGSTDGEGAVDVQALDWARVSQPATCLWWSEPWSSSSTVS